MKKWIIFIVLICGAGLWGAGADLSPLVVGTASGYAPYVSLNEQGKYEGFDIDIAETLAQKLGRRLVLKDLGSMSSLLLALKQGKVDALIWAISITEDRQKAFEMIYYQGDQVTSLPVICWKTIPEGIQTLEDLKKVTNSICVEAGSFQEDVLKKIPGIELKYLDKITDVIMDIKMGKSTCSAIDSSLVLRFLAQYPEMKVLTLQLPSSQQSLGNGICLNKANSVLVVQVRQAVNEMAKEGKIAELEKKWGLR